jgi:hypothetical protein
MSRHSGLLLHVAADITNLGIVGPIFQDMAFEFLPIPSDLGKLTYEQYPARNLQYGRNLADFIPSDKAGDSVHFDPDFQCRTYGQPIFYEGERFMRAHSPFSGSRCLLIIFGIVESTIC